MTELIVLLKLVPDIRHIPSDAWDLQRGTLRRNRLQLIPNPLDDRALALAIQIREAWGARVTTLSMGPPEAITVCRRALAFGADRAVLISDPACAGSDTLATSVVLARAIERLCDTTGDALILAGMQSPDGDTAQVPVQVAAMLGASVVPYVTAARTRATHVDLTSIASAGAMSTVISRDELPAVVTCTEELPSISFHTSLSELERAASSDVPIMTAAALGLDDREVGLAGSATRVVTISLASSVRREVDFIDWPLHGDTGRMASQVVNRLAAALAGDGASGLTGAVTSAGPQPVEVTGDETAPVLANSVWAVVGAQPDANRLGILAHARQIADAMGCAAVACRIVEGNSAVAEPDGVMNETLAAAGATDILTIAGVQFTDPVGLALILELAVARFRTRVLLLPASPEGRISAPYLAARLGAGLTADCTGFVVKDYTTRRGGERRTYRDALFQQRPALGGNIEATIVSPRNIESGMPQMATVRPGPTSEHPGARAVRTHRWVAEPVDEKDLRAAIGSIRAVEPDRDGDGGHHDTPVAHIDIERCKVLVSVGRGIGGERGITELARPLAEALRQRFNVDVEVSASRMVVDAGDLERDRQVGQTGKIVKPDIYIALGISGSAQHRAGMEGSAIIVSVNADADAPVRMISDVFVHGRVQDVVPPLIHALSRGRE